MNLYKKYNFHQGEFGEYTTEYKGYRIEISFDEKLNRYEADAFDLKAKNMFFILAQKLEIQLLNMLLKL